MKTRNIKNSGNIADNTVDSEIKGVKCIIHPFVEGALLVITPPISTRPMICDLDALDGIISCSTKPSCIEKTVSEFARRMFNGIQALSQKRSTIMQQVDSDLIKLDADLEKAGVQVKVIKKWRHLIKEVL